MKNGRIYYDATLVMEPGMPVYPGDKAPSFVEVASIPKGNICNTSFLSLGSHTGTHIDAPKHFIGTGCGIDVLSSEYFLGTARVINLPGRREITSADLFSFDITAGEIILIKTDNSDKINKDGYFTDFAYLSDDAARFLVKAGIRTFGFDYITVEKPDGGLFSVHLSLLGAGIPIIEGLDLSGVQPGTYGICALPLRIRGGDGSPARVILYTDS